MSHWNYRVVRRTFNVAGAVEERWAIHEAYYDDAGKVRSITKNGVGPRGDSLKELRESTIVMRRAFAAPVLDYDKIPEEGAVPFDMGGERMKEDAQ